MKLSPNARRRTLIAGLVGGGLVLATGVGPAPSLLAAASPSTSTTATTATTSTTGSTASAAVGSRTVDAAGVGTVTFDQSGGRLSLVSAVPRTGWAVEVEQAGGVEIEVDFRQGTRRVQVNLEIEDGAVRERVRVRDDADGTDIRLENGEVVRFDDGDDRRDDDQRDDDGVADDRDDDNSGPGSAGDDNSGPGSGGDDNSGPGSGDDHGDDNSGSGGGGDDG